MSLISLSAIVMYEHAITLGQEIEHIWKRKLSWMSAIYFVNRYGLFFGEIALLLMQFDWPGLTNKVGILVYALRI